MDVRTRMGIEICAKIWAGGLLECEMDDTGRASCAPFHSRWDEDMACFHLATRKDQEHQERWFEQ